MERFLIWGEINGVLKGQFSGCSAASFDEGEPPRTSSRRRWRALRGIGTRPGPTTSVSKTDFEGLAKACRSAEITFVDACRGSRPAPG